MRKPNVVFLTRHYPPSPNINGESVCDLVEFLEGQEVDSLVITKDRYSGGGGGKVREPRGEVIRMKTISESQHKYLRILAFLYDGLTMALKARTFKDVPIVVTSSPPMLPFWSAILFRKRKWIFWALDLFPEGFAVTGLVDRSNWFYRWVLRRTYEARPELIIALGEQQAQHLASKFETDIPTVILPCGVFPNQERIIEAPDWYEDDFITLGYCGNLNDAHNEEFLEAVIDHLDPKRHRLILALYGGKAERVKKYGKGKNGVVIVDAVPRGQLHFIDVHLVSLREEWTHVAVPSKAVSAISMGCPIMFCGSSESDNWAMFKDCGWLVDETGAVKSQVKTILSQLDINTIRQKKDQAETMSVRLSMIVEEAYRNINNYT